MSDLSAKPVIFISYSHKDEPDKPRDGEVQWLSFVRTYLQPAIKHGVFDLFVDEHLPGGAAFDPEIERKLHLRYLPLADLGQLDLFQLYHRYGNQDHARAARKLLCC